MIIQKPHLCSKLPVWNPKWSGKYADYGEPVALLHKRKVDFGSPILLIEFTKSPALKGQRFAIRKADAMNHEVGDNGSAPMYIIPISHFEAWQTADEVRETVNTLF